MAAKVTIQDIADALGLSRNTVSKAINNTGILADATRDRVLKKAAEMGYKQFSYVSDIMKNEEDILLQAASEPWEIALLTTKFLGDSHFSSTMLDKFQREISQLGYSLSMHRVLSYEIKGMRLPVSFNKERTSGIICYEMFDHAYSQMLCELEIPILFVDTPVVGFADTLKADRLYMDNRSGVSEFVREMVSRGKKNIGFVGEYTHCQSFFERYMAFRDTMYLLQAPIREEWCITGNMEVAGRTGRMQYQQYLEEELEKLPKLPDVFICANDFVAMDLYNALGEKGYRVPEDVYVCGFDDSPESRIIQPPLTTIHIHSQIMGYSAVQLLLSRIKDPDLNYRTVYTETKLIYRRSTED